MTSIFRIKQIEARSNAPESYEVFRTLKDEKIKYYKINVKNYWLKSHSPSILTRKWNNLRRLKDEDRVKSNV